MALKYFKRYRMEIELPGRDLTLPPLPECYRVVAWKPTLVDEHARTKYLSFRTEIDANVFPCLGEHDGCQRLMREIVRKTGFLPGATWLMAYEPDGPGDPEYCGTIQGICDHTGLGAVQNLGVVPEHRGRNLGTALLMAALNGFRAAGLRRAFLEVTAQNDGAIRLYRRLGFAKVRTVYKAAEIDYSETLARGTA
ncbi:MAG: GNAT family N-acetyltransferase [Pirellulales bacterium]|nr:GNAT family N-acetyltransferase [Pirellulales bacterium]